MTLSTLTSRVSYPGAGATGPFAVPFRFLENADLRVTKRSSAGAETLLTLTTHYTLTGAGDTTGTLTLVTALAVGETLVIRRKPANTQPMSIRNQGTYFPATIEDEFDRMAMQILALQDSVDRSVKLKETVAGGASLTELEPELGKAIVGTGTGFTMATLDSSAVALPGEGRTVLTLSAYLANNAVYNAEDFGVLTTNTGAANDARIAVLLAAVPATGGRVQFGDGAYEYNTSLVRPGAPTGAITIRGAAPIDIADDGGAGTILRYMGTGIAVRLGTDAAGVSLPTGQGFLLEDLKIDCNFDAAGVDIDNVSGPFFNRVMIQGPGVGTSTKTGLRLYDVQSGDFNRLEIFGFALGLDLQFNCLDIVFNEPMIDHNDVNVKTGSVGTLASVRFNGGAIQRPTTYCVDIVRAGGLSFNNVYWESNGTGKRCFRIGATAGVVPEGIRIIGGTMQGAGTPDSEFAIEVRRVRELHIEAVKWDNYTTALIDNVGTDVDGIYAIDNSRLSYGSDATLLSNSGAGFVYSRHAGLTAYGPVVPATYIERFKYSAAIAEIRRLVEVAAATWFSGTNAGGFTLLQRINGSTNPVVLDVDVNNNLIQAATWNTSHYIMGTFRLWMNATSKRIRGKASAPGSDVDGGTLGFCQVSADRGDTSPTLTVGTDEPTQRFATNLTANRTVTLSNTGAANGDKFRVVRTGLGAFTLDVGGLKTIPSATAAFVDVEYDGAAWRLTGYGTL